MGRSPIRLGVWRHPPAGGKVNPQGHNGERTPRAKATADATAKRNRRHRTSGRMVCTRETIVLYSPNLVLTSGRMVCTVDIQWFSTAQTLF